MKKFLIGLGIAVVVGGTLWLSLKGKDSGTSVEAEAAGKRTVSQIVKASGQIEPASKVEISTKVGGEIVDLPIKEGDHVKVGQVLVQIERETYQAALEQAVAMLDQAKSGVRRAQVQLADAKRNLRLTKEVFARAAATQQALDQAQLAYDVAGVDLESARHIVAQRRHAVDSARDDLARTTIRSPIDGEVIRLDVEKGETVVPGTMNLPGSVLLTVADMSSLLAEVDVNEVDVPLVHVGQKADVSLDSLGEKILHGKITEIATSGDKDATLGVVRFKVKVHILDPDPALRPAMTAKVSIYAEVHDDVVAVPIQAVVKRTLGADGKVPEGRAPKGVEPSEVVFTVKDGTAHLTRVETGISDALFVEVKKGLAVGTPIVVGPYRTLKEIKDGEEVDTEKKAPAEEKHEAQAKVVVD